MAKESKKIEGEEVTVVNNTLNVEETVKYIKKFQSVSDKDIELLNKYYDVKKHDVFDTSLREDRKQKSIKYEDGELVEEKAKDFKVNRAGIPIPNKVVKMAVSFAAGNPVNVEYEGGTEEQIKAIKKVLHDNKELSFNRQMCRALFAFREVAEIWYLDPEDNKIRGHLVSPMFGDKLYPVIDRKNKMLGFGFSNVYMNDEEKEVEELTYYTKEKIEVFEGIGGTWVLKDTKINVYGKIPVVYTNQGLADYEEVISSIERKERAVSNLGDSVDDSAYPDKVFIGKPLGSIHVPGEGSRYMVDAGGDVKVVESQQATSLIELDLKTHDSIISTSTDTPDLSLDNLKGLGQGLSGEVLKRMLTGAVLKVQDKREYLDTHYQRRFNLLNVMVCYGKNWNPDSLSISCEVVPYIPQDEDAELDRLRKMIGLMPMKYIVRQFKERVDSSIDVDEILDWLKNESVDDIANSFI